MSNQLAHIARRSSDGASVAEIAAELSVSEEWVELVMSSDAYQVIAYEHQQRPASDGK